MPQQPPEISTYEQAIVGCIRYRYGQLYGEDCKATDREILIQHAKSFSSFDIDAELLDVDDDCVEALHKMQNPGSSDVSGT